MILVSYTLKLTDDGHLIIKVGGKRPDHVYVAGKTRMKLSREVHFLLRVSDVPINRDRLQNQLDELIWNHVPKHQWY